MIYRLSWIIALLAVSWSFKVNQVHAQPVGTLVCGGCHPKELAAWQAGPHARAHLSLASHQRRDPHCRSCHDDAGISEQLRQVFLFKIKMVNVANGVDCESCHGLGEEILIKAKILKSNEINWKHIKHTNHTTHHTTPSISHHLRKRSQESCARCHELAPITSSIKNDKKQQQPFHKL